MQGATEQESLRDQNWNSKSWTTIDKLLQAECGHVWDLTSQGVQSQGTLPLLWVLSLGAWQVPQSNIEEDWPVLWQQEEKTEPILNMARGHLSSFHVLFSDKLAPNDLSGGNTCYDMV